MDTNPYSENDSTPELSGIWARDYDDDLDFTPPIFTVNVCKNYDPSRDKDYNNPRVAHGWEAEKVSWTEKAIQSLTTCHGISMNFYMDKVRRKEAWIGSTGIMLDFDDGKMTVEDLTKVQESWDFDSYLFSSQNHQKKKGDKSACDRLRMLVPLSTPTTQYQDIGLLKDWFLRQYPGIDKTCFGQARYFAHGTTVVSSFIGDRGFFDLSRFLKDYLSPESMEMISLDTIVTTADGLESRLDDLDSGTRIYCPVCGFDQKKRSGTAHNAVWGQKEGYDQPAIYCSSCESRGDGLQGVYPLGASGKEAQKKIDQRQSFLPPGDN
jgi:hypothetical protein